MLAAATLALLAFSVSGTRSAVATPEGAITYTVYQSPAAGSVLQVGATLTFRVAVVDAPGTFTGPVVYDLKKPANMSFASFGQQAGNVITACADNVPAAGYLRCTVGGGNSIPAGALVTGTGNEIVLNFAVDAAAAGTTYSDATMQALFSDPGSGFRNAGDAADSAAAGDSLDASVGGLTVPGAGANIAVATAASPATVFEGALSTVSVSFTHAFAPIGPLLQPIEIAVLNGDVQAATISCPGGTGSASLSGNVARCSGSTVASGDAMSVQVRARDTAGGDDVQATVSAPSVGLSGVVQAVGVDEVGLETVTLPSPGASAPPWTTGQVIAVCTMGVVGDVANDAAAGGAQAPGGVAGTSTLVSVTPLAAGDFSVTGPAGAVTFTYLGSAAASCGSGQSGVQFTASSAGSYAVTAAYNGDTTSAGTLAATRGTSTLSLTVQTTNPVPGLTSVSPSSVQAGSAGFTLTVQGSSFVPGSVVRWNGSDRTTSYVSSTQLAASIAPSDVAAAGTATVTVFNPAPGGGQSAGSTFTVTAAPNPAPLISNLVPASVNAGGPGFTITVNGSNFVTGATVTWNGAARTTTYLGPTQLTASVLAGDIAAAGSANVQVVNPAPGGGTSPAAAFGIVAVSNPAPSVSTLAPSSVTAGGPLFTLTVNGASFVPGAVVRWDGADRTTTYLSATQLTASISAADIALATSASVTVFNPGPGGGTSAALTLAVVNGGPTIATIAPSPVTAGGPGFTLTVNGTGFTAGSTVQLNGAARTTAYVSATQLTASLTAADIAVAGSASVTVTTPAPGGGTSAPATLAVDNPAPTVGSLSPAGATAGSGAFTLTVNGSGFVAASKVRWNGADRTTTFVSATQLTAAITAADVTTAGSTNVTVFNPSPGGGVSSATTFSVGASGPTSSDQLVVVAPPAGTKLARSRLAFRATVGTLAPTAVSFVVRRTSDGQYWNGSAGAWQADPYENAATADGGEWRYTVTGEARRLFAALTVEVEARATAGGAPYRSAAKATVDIR